MVEFIESVFNSVDQTTVVFRWGRTDTFGSAAYWIDQTRRHEHRDFRLGRSLEEEVVACILGGYGVRASVGLAAFEAVRERLLPQWERLEAAAVEEVLRTLTVPGRLGTVQHRFARQRAQRVVDALQFIRESCPPTEARELRDWLQGAPGIGPKTASWIVRNHLGSDDVAIIDIHIHRAGLHAGVFTEAWRLPRDYSLFERAFLRWATIGGVRPSTLDACIWAQLSELGVWGQRLLDRRPA